MLNFAAKMAETPTVNPKIGALYVVATPIGNLEDITLRALRILREADLIACEDTRHTQKLLNHYEIRKKLVSYHEHNEIARSAELVEQMHRGAQVALVSDAGTPAISDPGMRLVSAAIAAGIQVIPIPGASALATAIAASGLPSESVWFLGFPPSRSGERKKRLRAIAEMHVSSEIPVPTLIFYEAPHRVAEMLQDCVTILGERQAVVARELTKIHEEFLRGTLSELAEQFRGREARGEMTILIAPAAQAESREASKPTETSTVSISERIAAIMREKNVSQKEALKVAAREIGIPRREAYKRLLKEKG
jgi:16S rRNA (cytidine1402-2'-O)-methyltransferase